MTSPPPLKLRIILMRISETSETFVLENGWVGEVSPAFKKNRIETFVTFVTFVNSRDRLL